MSSEEVEKTNMNITFRENKYNLAELTKEELLQLKMEIDDEGFSIGEQIAKAQATKYETGIYTDADWYWSARRAKRHKVKQSQQIQAELSRRKGVKRMPDLFMDVARELLPADDFDRLYFLAEGRKANQ